MSAIASIFAIFAVPAALLCAVGWVCLAPSGIAALGLLAMVVAAIAWWFWLDGTLADHWPGDNPID